MNLTAGAGAPVIETQRLRLRAHGLEDFEDMAAMWADPDVMRYIGPPEDRPDTWARLMRYGGYWPLLGYGSWAAREAATGRFVGDFGFRGLWQDGHEPGGGAVEAGWVAAAWTHGRGFAGEAMRAVLEWLDGQAGIQRSMCMIDPANAASLRLAKRLGFDSAMTVDVRGDAAVCMVRPRA